MDGQYWKGDRTMSTNVWLLTSDFWQFLEPWHGRWYEYEIFIASCTDNICDLENERWLLGDMIDHVGIYGSKVAKGLSAFNAGLVPISDSKVHWANMGPTWVLSAPAGPHVGPMNLAIRDYFSNFLFIAWCVKDAGIHCGYLLCIIFL